MILLSSLLTLAPQPVSSNSCDASCLDAVEGGEWPPEGFVEDETAVRCALRCAQDAVQVSIQYRLTLNC